MYECMYEWVGQDTTPNRRNLRSHFNLIHTCHIFFINCCYRDMTTATDIPGKFSTTITEVFSVFFLSCKAKKGHGPYSQFFFLFIVMYVPFSVSCVLYYCQRVSTQLQLKINNKNNKIRNILLFTHTSTKQYSSISFPNKIMYIVNVCLEKMQSFTSLMKTSPQGNFECCGRTRGSNRFAEQQNPSTF
jgi:hypothetical protein